MTSHSETDLYSPIVEAARVARLATLVRLQAGRVKVRGGWMMLAPPGAPDLIGWMIRGPKRGAVVGLEVKRPGEQATAIQCAWRFEIQRAGGIAGCVHSVDEALKLLLRAAAPEAA
jgi:hypothetical protein